MTPCARHWGHWFARRAEIMSMTLCGERRQWPSSVRSRAPDRHDYVPRPTMSQLDMGGQMRVCVPSQTGTGSLKTQQYQDVRLTASLYHLGANEDCPPPRRLCRHGNELPTRSQRQVWCRMAPTVPQAPALPRTWYRRTTIRRRQSPLPQRSCDPPMPMPSTRRRC